MKLHGEYSRVLDQVDDYNGTKTFYVKPDLYPGFSAALKASFAADNTIGADKWNKAAKLFISHPAFDEEGEPNGRKYTGARQAVLDYCANTQGLTVPGVVSDANPEQLVGAVEYLKKNIKSDDRDAWTMLITSGVRPWQIVLGPMFPEKTDGFMITEKQGNWKFQIQTPTKGAQYLRKKKHQSQRNR